MFTYIQIYYGIGNDLLHYTYKKVYFIQVQTNIKYFILLYISGSKFFDISHQNFDVHNKNC